MLTLTHEQLESLRPALLRFASLQLRNDSQAEDVVQDALVAVLEKPDGYAGRSSLRSYVIGIMKHKIVDLLRARQRTRQLDDADKAGESEDDDIATALFAADGHALAQPHYWGSPEATLHQQDFFRTLELCLEKLPPKTARIFMMREWLGLGTREICTELGMTESGVWVTLYRARLGLRECLELHWFGNRRAPAAQRKD